MVTGHLLLVALPELHTLTPLRVLRQSVEFVPFPHVVDSASGDFDVVVAQQVPGYRLLAEMVSAPQVQDVLFEVSRSPELRILWTRLEVNQGALAIASIRALSFIEGLAGDAEATTSCGSITDLFGVAQDLELAANVRQRFGCHREPPG